MSDEAFVEGELFVYTNGDRWELGMVKRPNNAGNGYFCWYSTGDTAANTPTRCMHKLANAGWTRIEQRMDELENLCRDLCRAMLREEVAEPYQGLRDRMEALGLLDRSES